MKLGTSKLSRIDGTFMEQLLINNREKCFFDNFTLFKKYYENDSIGLNNNILKCFEMATIRGATNVVKFLILTETIDVNQLDKVCTWKYPPTFVACMQGYYDIVEFFLTLPNMKFDFVKKAEFALEKNSKTTILIEICRKFDGTPSLKANVNFKKCFDMIIKDDRCTTEIINLRDLYGCTALHYTCFHNQDDAAIDLLRKHANPFIRNNLSKIAMPISVMKRKKIQRFIVKHFHRTNFRLDDILRMIFFFVER